MQASQWAPTPEPAIVNHEDQFAQTRQPDDLFDDDFTPIAAPVLQPTPSQHHAQPHQPRASNNEYQSRGRGRGYGPRPTNNYRSQPSQPQETSATDPNIDPQSPPTDPDTKPRPTPAARGNRLPTGGVQKPKLTEDQLSARLAAVKLNNARREEAHRIAEADEASFQQREAQAREKRREEGAARRVMEGERERNRLRKLGARGGREWDEGKKEEDFSASNRRGGGYRRGMHGGVAQPRNTDGEPFTTIGRDGGDGDDGYNTSAAVPRGRGAGYEGGRGGYEGSGRRGGRGRSGRGRGRGYRGGDQSGFVGHHQASAPAKDANFAETDFPALTSEGGDEKPAEKIHTIGNSDLNSPNGEKASWADQMEAGSSTDQAV